DLLIKTIKPFYKQIIDSETIRYGVKCKKFMGVTDKAIESQYVLVEINKSSGISHAYPCLEEKAKSCATITEKLCDQIFYNDDDHENLDEEISIKLYIELE